ncbi:MAG: response regulator transcription factor [Anaerolineae bacterium]|nr:response regulator transcription factor [Anaerolineae bacterium]
MKAFIFADDPDEGNLLKTILGYIGLEVTVSLQLEPVLENWPQDSAELVILAADDNTVLMKKVVDVRATTQVPLLTIADALPEESLCAMLTTGADLVLERPVSPRVLANYARVLLRRSETVPAFVLTSLELDEITLNPSTRTVTVAGQEPRRLTHLEFRLLYVLMTNREQVLPADTIVDRVWGYNGGGDRDLVRGLISRLRRKLEPDPEQPCFIQTITGVGYMFTLEPQPDSF